MEKKIQDGIAPSAKLRLSGFLLGGVTNRNLAIHPVVKKYKRNESIFHIGNPAAGIYLVESGIVKLEVFGPEGQAHILRVYKENEFFGYRAWLAHGDYRANAIAQEDCEISWIPGHEFAEIMREFPELLEKLFSSLTSELAQAEARICALTDKAVRARVADALLFLEDYSKERQWTRKEIAEWAGTTPESVMRVLADFQQAAVVSLKGRKIHILQSEELRNIGFGY